MDLGKFKTDRKRVLEIDQELKNLEKEKEDLLKNLQASCDHKLIIEFDNHMANLGDIRICALCGAREKHEGCGFGLLTKKPLIKKPDKSELQQFRDLKPLTELVNEDLIATLFELS